MGADPRAILFVITSSTNMGDLALCQEWTADLGRTDYRFGFVIHPGMAGYLEKGEDDAVFPYDADLDARETILGACQVFHPDVIIFATNAFWNIPGQKGATFGKFILEENDVDVPVCSFDPFEIGFDHVMPQTGGVIPFSPVPDWVWALRYMSRRPLAPNAVHFCTSKAFEAPAAAPRQEIVSRWGGDPARRSVLFPISRNRYNFIRTHYPGYYAHLTEVFTLLPQAEVQVFLVHPERVPEFQDCPQVIQLGLVPFHDFLDLIYACDLYLTDSFVSCMVNAYHIGTPSLLLANSPESERAKAATFLEDGFFPYRVFPYGMYEICQELEALHEVRSNYVMAEVLDQAAVARTIMELVADTPLRRRIRESCRQWKKSRMELPSPEEVLKKIWASPHLNPEK